MVPQLHRFGLNMEMQFEDQIDTVGYVNLENADSYDDITFIPFDLAHLNEHIPFPLTEFDILDYQEFF
jgi:hypothetical protein